MLTQNLSLTEINTVGSTLLTTVTHVACCNHLGHHNSMQSTNTLDKYLHTRSYVVLACYCICLCRLAKHILCCWSKRFQTNNGPTQKRWTSNVLVRKFQSNCGSSWKPVWKIALKTRWWLVTIHWPRIYAWKTSQVEYLRSNAQSTCRFLYVHLRLFSELVFNKSWPDFLFCHQMHCSLLCSLPAWCFTLNKNITA